VSKLVLQSLLNFVIGGTVLGALLFIPAGTIHYWQAWVFILVFGASSNALGIYLSLADPVLLERRKHILPPAGSSHAQTAIVALMGLGVLSLLVVPALDHRLGWSTIPAYVAILGDLVVALSFVGFYFVFRENSFGGSTVEIFEGQQVVSTGPYAVIRHPMYAGVVVMSVGAVLALGSLWALLVIVLLQIPTLVWRILDEERLLRSDLPGYEDYMRTVRYRLVPRLW